MIGACGVLSFRKTLSPAAGADSPGGPLPPTVGSSDRGTASVGGPIVESSSRHSAGQSAVARLGESGLDWVCSTSGET